MNHANFQYLWVQFCPYLKNRSLPLGLNEYNIMQGQQKLFSIMSSDCLWVEYYIRVKLVTSMHAQKLQKRPSNDNLKR